MKECTVCKELKSPDEFYNCSKNVDGKQYRCKVCDNKAVKDYRARNSEQFKAIQRSANLKHRYGMTPEDYENMFDSQNRCCKICGEHELDNNARFVVDHCHDTGRVRGILCNSCNRGLGYFGDCPHNLRDAADYLVQAEIH
jgi:hypothetical protein